MPDNFFFHYQNLLGGLCALLGGAFVLLQARMQISAEKKKAERVLYQRRVAFSAIVFQELTEFISEMRIILIDLEEYQERLGADASFISRIEGLEFPEATMYLYEDWRGQIGFSIETIVSLWVLRSEIKNFNLKVDRLRSNGRSEITQLPLFRDSGNEAKISELRRRVAEVQLAGDQTLAAATQLEERMGSTVPQKLRDAIRRGDVNEVTVGGLQRGHSESRTSKGSAS